MHRKSILLISVIILAVALRLFYLGQIPNGFYSDEAAYGYNAYSILQTGKDEYGNFLPLAFKSFGDWKTPLYIYFLVPFVWLFGLSEWSVRFSSAVLGIGSVILIYYLARKLLNNRKLALLASFFAAISPFALQFSRMAHENNLVVFLVLLGLLFFLKSLQSINFLFLSFLSFVLAIYTYHDARVFVPLFLLILLFIYRRNFAKFWQKLLLAVIFSSLFLLPFLNLLRSDAFWSRPKFTIISSDPGITLRINEERGEDMTSLFFEPRLFHNKVVSYIFTFLENYAKHFNFEFLFLRGDPVKIYSTVGTGLLYLASLPFIIYGVYLLFHKNLPSKWLVISWVIIAPIASSLTRFVPSASRILTVMPVFSLLCALGLNEGLRFGRPAAKKMFSIAVACLFALNIAYYLHYYYFNTNLRFAKEWHYGMKEVMEEVKLRQGKYDQIWFSKNAWGYIYPLFYLPYPPAKYQQQAKLSQLNQFGFGWVERFDKYVFADIPELSLLDENTLYVSAPEDRFKGIKPLSSIYYPDGKIAFYLFDKSSIP